MGIMKTPSPVNSISGDLERAASEKEREGARLYTSLQQGAGNLNIKRLLLIKETQVPCIKGFSAFLCMGRYKHPGLLKLFFMCIASILGQILPLDCSCPSFLGHHEGWWMWQVAASNTFLHSPPSRHPPTPIPQCLPGKRLVAAK